MKVVSGTLYTDNEHAAEQFRTMFWDSLEFQSFKIKDYIEQDAGRSVGKPNWSYTLRFRFAPKDKFTTYRSIWIGNNAIYPRTAGGEFHHREYTRGRNIDPYFVDALKFAKDHAPCLVVVESLSAMDMAYSVLSKVGVVWCMHSTVPQEDRRARLMAFDKFGERSSFLIVTKPFAQAGGFRLSKPEVTLAASCLMTPEGAAQVLGRVARISQPHGRYEVVTPHHFIKTTETQ